eukprot:IDg23389t1
MCARCSRAVEHLAGAVRERYDMRDGGFATADAVRATLKRTVLLACQQRTVVNISALKPTRPDAIRFSIALALPVSVRSGEHCCASCVRVPDGAERRRETRQCYQCLPFRCIVCALVCACARFAKGSHTSPFLPRAAPSYRNS